MAQRVQLATTMSENQLDQRLDQALAEMSPDYLRSRIKEWIFDQCVLVNGKVCDKPRGKVLGSERIAINAETEEEARFESQGIPLDTVYEDGGIIVIDKLRDLVVHPGAGSPGGTVLNVLFHYYPPIADVPRVSAVHRLNKGTTDLMVVVKVVPAQMCLVESLQRREIIREHEAAATGHMTVGGIVDEPTSHRPTKRTHMAVHPIGKSVIAHYRITGYFRVHTRLWLCLETERTRQTRMRMVHTTHPLMGDPVYGGRPYSPKDVSEAFISTLYKFGRQSLHAIVLCLYHPTSDIEMEWHVPIPQDMVELIEVTHADFEEHKNKVDRS